MDKKTQGERHGTRVCALTPTGRGGVAVVEIFGPRALACAAEVGLGFKPGGSLTLSELQGPQGRLDEALIWWRGPQHLELHLHGSPAVVDSVLTLLRRPLSGRGAEAAPEKSIESVAENLAAHAPSEVGARLALAQAEGALRAALTELLGKGDNELSSGLRELADLGRQTLPWFVPLRVVLQGPVNAGKSTLFNAVVGHGRVITSPLAGSTRDAVMQRTMLGNLPIDLVDTAGLRQATSDELERRGQDLGRGAAAAADVVVFLRPPGFAGSVPAGALVLDTQGDRPGAAAGAVSALKQPAEAAKWLQTQLQARSGVPTPVPFARPLPVGLAWTESMERVAALSAGSEQRKAIRDWLDRI